MYALGFLVVTGLAGGDWHNALMRTAAITAVACPCAWALAVPTAFAAAVGGLGRKGVLVRSGDSLEQIGRVKHVVLDKTGTLTLARPRVEQVYGLDTDSENVLAMAIAVEIGFNHPIATAILNYAKIKHIAPPSAGAHAYLPGMGVRARVEGREVVLGAADTMQQMGITLPGDVPLSGHAVVGGGGRMYCWCYRNYG